MRSATSYFNGTLYRKTLARYWPLWGLYGVIWVFLVPLNMLNNFMNNARSIYDGDNFSYVIDWRLRQAVSLPEWVSLGLYLAAFFAILCAMAVFGYLYSSRSACWFHALPTRREALFTTQYLAGLSFLLLPQLAAAVLTAIVEVSFLPTEHWGKALSALLVWLAAQSGICLFFFSFAAFCAMFTGHILALPAFYAILNVLAEVIYFLVEALMTEFFFGYAGSSGAQTVVEYLTPVAALKDAAILYRDDGWYFNSPGTIAAYAAVGVVLALLSLYVYRRRHVETAGDVVSIPLVRPLFKYGVSFCAGLCFGMFTAAFFGWRSASILIPCILIWSVIGYFAAEMLLKKSFRVWRAWKGGAVMAAVMLVLCLACTMDLFGVEAQVPKLDQVESLTVYFNMGYPGDDGYHLSVELTDPAQIQQFLALHQAIADDRDRLDSSSESFSAGNDYTTLRLRYNLKGGSSMSRDYGSIPLYRADLNQKGSVTWLVSQMLQDRELVAKAYAFEDRLNGYRLTGAWLYMLNDANGDLTYDDFYMDGYSQELWDAVQQDFAEGTIGVRYLFDLDGEWKANTYRTDLCFDLSPVYDLNDAMEGEINYTRSSSLTVTLTPQARHTLAVLEKTGVFDEGYSLSSYDAGDNGYPHTAAARNP